MAKDFAEMENSNPSSNTTIHEMSKPQRRTVLAGGVTGALTAMFGSSLTGCASSSVLGHGNSTVGSTPVAMSSPRAPKLNFTAIGTDMADRVVVPPGYTATPFAAWGEPIGLPGNMPAFKFDASNSAADQEAQIGMHHDGLHFYSLNASGTRGLLVMNHEYTDDGLLHVNGMADWSAEKVRKSQAAHGVSVIEVIQNAAAPGGWEMVRPSKFARRFTAYSPFAVQGPAAGHSMMKTNADPTGALVLGTLNNCASGMTPWGTYLSGEENWGFYFDAGKNLSDHQKRWGLREKGLYGWSQFDERFNAEKNPNEPNRFGWVVEIDPTDPTSVPIKRTALGRAAHEGAWIAVTKDNRAVVYSGEDARNEYIYKFVSRDTIAQGGAKANRQLLDFGTLYVAKFLSDGTGQWLPLVFAQGPLTVANGFADQGEVVIKARQAADLLGATKMDRPEWLAIDPHNGEVYCTLTNNSTRGKAIAIDAANPRADNVMGQIIRWKEDKDFHATSFVWNHLVMAGDPANTRLEAKGNIKGDLYACPDGISFDKFGTLWIQTDAHATVMYKGEMKNIGNNQMLACDPSTGVTKRFFTGPVNSEVTGLAFSPDGKTMFLNIQHPGETPSDRSNPLEPSKYSHWPNASANLRPRSATVIIRKNDGGIIGA
jgi:uncharacterized protein